MAAVNGRVVFDSNRTGIYNNLMTGIGGKTVILRSATGTTYTTTTDPSGAYSFANIPAGTYTVSDSPVSVSDVPSGSLPSGTTNIDWTGQQTYNITVGATDVSQNFLHGPVAYTPISSPNVVIDPTNIITDFNNGTFGTFGSDTSVNTSANPNPYPNIGSQLSFTGQSQAASIIPNDGQYTIQNTLKNYTTDTTKLWWVTADHTTGNETGRFMVVNGKNPGTNLLTTTVPVTPNTNYLFSAWVTNLVKLASLETPQLGVKITAPNGTVLYNSNIGTALPPTGVPEWKQIGTVLNSGSNSSLTLSLVSNGEIAAGNDFGIDDIALQKITLPPYTPPTPTKTGNKNTVGIGDTVTYTVTLENTGEFPLTNASIKDAIPAGLTFVPGSVVVNGISQPNVDLSTGFSLPSISVGQTVTVVYKAKATSIPAANPVNNTATMSFGYNPVAGGIPVMYNVPSNTVPVTVTPLADVSVFKYGSPDKLAPGQTVNYRIRVTNAGPSPATNVVVTDSVPETILNPQYSVAGSPLQPWPGSYTIPNLNEGEVYEIQIQGTRSATMGPRTLQAPNQAQKSEGNIDIGLFQQMVVYSYYNTATVKSDTPDPNTNNNTSTVPVTPVDTAQTPTSADLSITKTAMPVVAAGGQITYTINTTNNGPDTAIWVYVVDAVPAEIPNPQFSLDGGITWKAWPGGYEYNSIANGVTEKILIRGTIDPDRTDPVINNVSVFSQTPDPNLSNNNSTIISQVAPSADVSIIKTATPNQVQNFDMLTYTLAISNSGPSNAQNVIIKDAVPASLINPEYSLNNGLTFAPWTGSLSIPVLEVNDNRTIQIRGRVTEASQSSIANVATVESTTPDPDLTNNRREVTVKTTALADLAIVKTADLNPVAPGSNAAFTLTVTNNGPSDANDVLIKDTLSPIITNPQYSFDNAVWNPWTGEVLLPATLKNGQNMKVYIKGTVDPKAKDPILNTATVISALPDHKTINNTSTVSLMLTETTPPPTPPASTDLVILKTAAPNPVNPGSSVMFTLTVTNNGPIDAPDILIQDTLSPMITNPQYSFDNAVWNPWTGKVVLPTTLKNGQSTRVYIRGTVDPKTMDPILNTAMVFSPLMNHNTINNTSTVILTPTGTTPPTPDVADVSVIFTANPDSFVKTCYPITYSIIVINAGPKAAENVVLTDNLPCEIINAEYVTSQTPYESPKPWKNSLALGTMAAGSTIIIRITGTVSSNAKCDLTNTANVSSSTPDSNTNNNQYSLSTKINKYRC